MVGRRGLQGVLPRWQVEGVRAICARLGGAGLGRVRISRHCGRREDGLGVRVPHGAGQPAQAGSELTAGQRSQRWGTESHGQRHGQGHDGRTGPIMDAMHRRTPPQRPHPGTPHAQGSAPGIPIPGKRTKTRWAVLELRPSGFAAVTGIDE